MSALLHTFSPDKYTLWQYNPGSTLARIPPAPVASENLPEASTKGARERGNKSFAISFVHFAFNVCLALSLCFYLLCTFGYFSHILSKRLFISLLLRSFLVIVSRPSLSLLPNRFLLTFLPAAHPPHLPSCPFLLTSNCSQCSRLTPFRYFDSVRSGCLSRLSCQPVTLITRASNTYSYSVTKESPVCTHVPRVTHVGIRRIYTVEKTVIVLVTPSYGCLVPRITREYNLPALVLAPPRSATWLTNHRG